MIDATRLRQLIRAATPGPLRINRYDNVSDINYQLQSGWHAPGGGLEPQQIDEDFAVVANIRDDECPRAKPTAELIMELYNHAEEVAGLQDELSEARSGYHELDHNWATMHDLAMGALRGALEMPEATVPELCQEILRLRNSELAQSKAGALAALDELQCPYITIQGFEVDALRRRTGEWKP